MLAAKKLGSRSTLLLTNVGSLGSTFSCLKWLNSGALLGLQTPAGGSCELGKGSVCNRHCACLILAQPQRADSGPALSGAKEPVGAGCGPSGLVSVWGPKGSKDACLKARLIPPNQALGGFSRLPPQGWEALSLGSCLQGLGVLPGLHLTLFPSFHILIPVTPLTHPLTPIQLSHYHPG